MKSVFQFGCCLPLFILLLPHVAVAHGDLHGRIEAISMRIRAEATNIDLLFERGALHEQHGDFAAAIKDFEIVDRLDPNREGLHFSLARCLFALARFDEALGEIDRAQLPLSDGGRVLLWRGRILAKLGRTEVAAHSYRAAFGQIQTASPDLYIEFARMISAAGTNHYPEAIAGLDEGIERMGPVITLNLAALELQETVGSFEAALLRVNRMLAQNPDMVALLRRKGDILVKMGRAGEATSCYRQALETMESLPPARRRTQANLELEQEIRRRISVTVQTE